MWKNYLQSCFIPLSGKPEEKEDAETPKTSDNLMPLQNSPSEMLVRTVQTTENEGVQVIIQGLLKEKVLLQFLPKSEGAIASPTPLLPTSLLLDKENKNDSDITIDPCPNEHEPLVKEDSVAVTIHESTDEKIEAEKIVEIQVHKEETDEMEMMPLT